MKKTTEEKLKEFADRIETELNACGDVVLERKEAERLVTLMRIAADETLDFWLWADSNAQDHV
jgi:hypothetical protein